MNKLANILIITILSASVCFAQTPAKKISITIDTDKVLNSFETIPLGLNLNFYLDSDRATKASTKIDEVISNMGVKYLRYPGGDKADEYLFAYPPYDKSEPNPAIHGVPKASRNRNFFMNSDGTGYKFEPMGFDEFMEICKKTGCEPVIVVACDNRNSPTREGAHVSTQEDYLRNAVEWVRYANIKKGYDIKYWMIGNESWHKHVSKFYSANDYAEDVALFSDAMKKIDPSIKIIPNTSQRPEHVKALFEGAKGKFDMVCISNYSMFDSKMGYNSWAGRHRSPIRSYNRVVNSIKNNTSAENHSIPIMIAEFAATDAKNENWNSDHDLAHVLCNFDIVGKQLQEPRIFCSLFWNTRWRYDNDDVITCAIDRENNLLPAGQTLQMWGKNIYSQMVSAQSSTKEIEVFCSLDKTGKKAYVYVINKFETVCDLSLDFGSKQVQIIEQVSKLWGDSLTDMRPEKSDQIVKLSGDTIEAAPYSITIFRLALN